MTQVGAEVGLARELKRMTHNSAAERVRAAMAEAGWVNPDGHGFIYYHPDIKGADGSPVEMLGGTAQEIQECWEETARNTANEVPEPPVGEDTE